MILPQNESLVHEDPRSLLDVQILVRAGGISARGGCASGAEPPTCPMAIGPLSVCSNARGRNRTCNLLRVMETLYH